MKKESIVKEVFISDDGIQFDTEDECLSHERKIKGIKHYRILYDPDLNETGIHNKKMYVAILYDKCPSMADDILLEYIYRKFKHILGPGVMGYGVLCHVNFHECSKEEYMECPITDWGPRHKSEQVFLSNVEMKDYPKPINFLKEWGLDK